MSDRLRILHFWDGFAGKAYRNQLGFIMKLKDKCDLMLYGPGMDKKNGGRWKENIPIHYDRNHEETIINLIQRLKPDVILLHFQKRAHNSVPRDFKDIHMGVPRILIDTNPWDGDQKWRKNMKIDLVLDRDPNLKNKKMNRVPSIFFPLSADEDDFYFDNTIKRVEDRILFLGSNRSNEYYKVRNEAIKILSENNLLARRGKGLCLDKQKSHEYPPKLRKYKFALSDAISDWGVCPSKVYEYMASKMVVLCNQIGRDDILFGNKQCYFKYKDDCSDFLDVVKYVLDEKNKEYVDEVAENAHDVVHKKHMHKHRADELIKIITEFVEHGRILNRWTYDET